MGKKENIVINSYRSTRLLERWVKLAMTKPQRAIAIFQTSSDTEAALKKLDNSQFALERVFVIARNTDREKR